MAGKRRMILRNQQGFTLVETLVTGVIAVIIAASVFVAYITYDLRSRESISFLKMQRQYENIAEQIAHDARSASSIRPAGEACGASGASVVTTSISMFDELCNAGAWYHITGDTLYKGASPLEAGGGAVALAAGSGFFLPDSRDAVELRLAIKIQARDTSYTLSTRKELFQCRGKKP